MSTAASTPMLPAPEGTISFEYRNHDGNLVIGTPPWRFSTRWAPAAENQIHVLRHGNTGGVSIAQGVSKIEDVTEAVIDRSNFSSRSRSPAIRQVVILENDTGYLAAVQIDAVSYGPDGEPGSVLNARYKILTDGSRDFSGATASPEKEVRAAAADALAALPPPGAEPAPTVPGVGHNNPPPSDALTPEQRHELERALGEIAAGTVSPTSPPEEKSRVRRTIERGLEWVLAYWRMTTKQLAEETNKMLGAAVLAYLMPWSTFMEKLEKVWTLLSGLF